LHSELKLGGRTGEVEATMAKKLDCRRKLWVGEKNSIWKRNCKCSKEGYFEW